MIRAAIYCRVSTEEQAAEGMSIMAQRKLLADYAIKNQMVVVDEFVDEGVSARSADRPQFQRMISCAKKKPKPFDIILIHKTDRFARNREDAIVYKSLLRRDCDIEVLSTTEQFEDSPTGKLLEGMMEVMAEFYSLNLSQETLKGMKEGASQGRAMGLPPLGYRVGESGRYEIVDEEAAVVRWIFETYTKEQKGLLAIAQRLHADGVRMFGPAGSKYNWSGVGIRVILKNPAYIGNLVWNRRNGAKKKRMRDPEEWIVTENAHEPIINKETLELAARILTGRRGPRTPVEDYILRGIARCADCGHSMCYYQQQWRRANGERMVNPQLSCVTYQQSRQCYFNHVNIRDVEAALYAYLGQVAEGRVDAAKLDVTFPHLDSVRGEAEDLRRQIDGIAGKFQRQVQAYEAGALDLSDLKTARERLNQEKQALERRLAEVKARLDLKAHHHLAGLQGRIRDVLDSITNSSLSPATRREALKSVVDHIEYSRRRDELKIVLKLA